MPTTEQIRERLKACHQAQVELETRAGIAEAAKRLREKPPSYFAAYDVGENHSDERRKAVQQEEELHERRTDKQLRELYFSVPDLELRNKLIVNDREAEILAVDSWRQELSKVAAKLKRARRSHAHWWLPATIIGGGFIVVGFKIFGLVGAFVGLLGGYFYGRRIEAQALRARADEVSAAEQDLLETEEIWNSVRNLPPLFPQSPDDDGFQIRH